MIACQEKSGEALVEVSNLQKLFPIKKGFLHKTSGYVRAVDDVSFDIYKGEILSLVGESGCGKTTTSRCIIGAVRPTQGSVIFHTSGASGINVAAASQKELRPLRHSVQMIFQDPYSSLNPRMTIFEIIGEPLLVNGMKDKSERMERVLELLRMVGLRREYIDRFPHAFSGGQRQRIGIARALALNPEFIIADEPVSALDVSVQAQILNLLLDLQDNLKLTFLFVGHDLSVVKNISDRVAVMYVGKIVELAGASELFENPLHPYTEALINAVPKPDPGEKYQISGLPGEVADAGNPPGGCYFHPRCKYADETCGAVSLNLEEAAPGHFVRCHKSTNLKLKGV
jgi:peptide/nickel transport system ATP-binding protein